MHKEDPEFYEDYELIVDFDNLTVRNNACLLFEPAPTDRFQS